MCAKGAEKAWCGETVVQKSIFEESVSSLPPLGLILKHLKTLRGAEKKRTLQKTTIFPHDAFSAPLVRSDTFCCFQRLFWVHCQRRGSEKSTFLAIFWGGGDFLRCACSLGAPIQDPLYWMRLFYLQLRHFAYGSSFLNYGGEPEAEKTKPNFSGKMC